MEALIPYSGRGLPRPFYYANAHEKDRVEVELHPMELHDARAIDARIDREGFQLLRHVSKVADFTDAEAVRSLHPAEVQALIREVTGADEVQITSPGILRFSERSGRTGSTDNSHPARFVHIDISDDTAAQFAARGAQGRSYSRCVAYNLWRAVSPPPQDVPLAFCDARSLIAEDLIVADAIFDPPGGAPEWSFESWVVAHNPAHRWYYFPNMTADEAVLFKTNDSDPRFAHCIPHVAFDDPTAPADAPPRISIEVRATCYWWA